MISALRQWFAALSLREKRLVLVAVALAIVTLLWFGIIRPINDGLSSARARHNGAVLRLAETGAAMQTLKSLQRDRPAPLAVPLDQAIRDSATQAGFALESVTPQAGNAQQIMIASARPAALFGWIATLEADGIIVDTLSASDNGDQTVAVTMTLKARGL